MKKYAVFSMMMVLVASLSAQPYRLPEVKYSYDALEPHIDARTMEIHHSRHHQGYVNNLNKAVAGTAMENLTLTDLMLSAGTMGAAIRNNGGGHYNHTLFWEILSPTPSKTPSSTLMREIVSGFGTIDSLQQEINKTAMAQFGSGWAWLVVTPERKLAVTSTPNQDNPLMDVAVLKGIPILGIDVWEHAYYLHYQNRRADYLKSIWNVIDWSVVSRNYEEALKSPVLGKLKQ